MTSREHVAGIKRSLTHLGGDVETEGDAQPARALAEALDVAGADAPGRHKLPDEPAARDDDEPDRAHVHGFHAYPARIHPVTASRLITGLCRPGGVVLDPFCGSGTVLVEAMIAGRTARGSDLNPLAVRLARWKTAARSPAAGRAVVDGAARARAHAESRRKEKAGPTIRYGEDDRAAFDTHVLLELDGIRAGIFAERDPDVRGALLLVLSAIIVKVSRKRSDTNDHHAEKRIAAGYSGKLFLRKAEEFSRRSAAFESLLPAPRRSAEVFEDDATQLASIGPASVDTIVSSPPYAGTYDYLAHHALRLRWLGLDAAALESGELGSRRRYAVMSAQQAEEAWVAELAKFLGAAKRVLKPGGGVALVLADSEAGGHALRADVLAATAALQAGLIPSARASQDRPHFHDARAFVREPRREHALYFRKR